MWDNSRRFIAGVSVSASSGLKDPEGLTGLCQGEEAEQRNGVSLRCQQGCRYLWPCSSHTELLGERSGPGLVCRPQSLLAPGGGLSVRESG